MTDLFSKRVEHIAVDNEGGIVVFDDFIKAKRYAVPLGMWYGTVYTNKKFIKEDSMGLVVKELE